MSLFSGGDTRHGVAGNPWPAVQVWVGYGFEDSYLYPYPHKPIGKTRAGIKTHAKHYQWVGSMDRLLGWWALNPSGKSVVNFFYFRLHNFVLFTSIMYNNLNPINLALLTSVCTMFLHTIQCIHSSLSPYCAMVCHKSVLLCNARVQLADYLHSIGDVCMAVSAHASAMCDCLHDCQNCQTEPFQVLLLMFGLCKWSDKIVVDDSSLH